MNVSYSKIDGVIEKTVDKETQTYSIRPVSAGKHLRVNLQDGQVLNDGTDAETVTVELVDGLAVARGNKPDVLAESGTLTLSIDGAEVSVPIDAGTGTKDVTTTQSAGSTIDVEAVGYDGGPIEADAATIEVIQA